MKLKEKIHEGLFGDCTRRIKKMGTKMFQKVVKSLYENQKLLTEKNILINK